MGYDEMPEIIANAERDIAPHLWTFYWLARQSWWIVELGVRNGSSTRAWLAGLRDGEGAGRRLVSFDKDGDAYHVRAKHIEAGKTWINDFWQCEQKDSALAGHEWRMKVDWVFVDTDHSLETTRKEIAEWHVHANKGMVFHDTNLNEPGRDGVRPALLEFVAANPGWRFEDHPHICDGDTGLGILWRCN